MYIYILTASCIYLALFNAETLASRDLAAPGRSDLGSRDGGEHLDDGPEHRTGGVATGGCDG